MLYPQTNQFRTAITLDGLWQFKKMPSGREARAQKKRIPEKCEFIPVPCAYNEITQDASLREYSGWINFYCTFYNSLQHYPEIVLRFGAVNYYSEVYINGNLAGNNYGGKLPFEFEIKKYLTDGENILTVVSNNILTWQTIPPGDPEINTDSSGIILNRERYFFDFLNYGGILRSVWLCGMPAHRISDITVKTASVRNIPTGFEYIVFPSNNVNISICDAQGRHVLSVKNQPCHGTISIKNPVCWCPENPHLYTIHFALTDGSDAYTITTGLRTIHIHKNSFYLNNKKFYFKGCSMHEDFRLHGHGHSRARMVKDFNLLKWIGANSIRTSHYPYDEEVYFHADRTGILVIDELPAVGQCYDGRSQKAFQKNRIYSQSLNNHLGMLRRLYARDKNHPSVIMWSLGNEPACNEKAADAYYSKLAAEMKKLDPGRPVTYVCNSFPPCSGYGSRGSKILQTKMNMKKFDVICLNKYNGWYSDAGNLDDAVHNLRLELNKWHSYYKDKPILITEFGADSVQGMHSDPPLMFSEEYQKEFIKAYIELFKTLPYITGEHIWNFADFATKQGFFRVMGNRKGIFTREREPKLAAHFLRSHWKTEKVFDK